LEALGINAGLLLIQIVGFILLVLLLNFVLYKPILNALQTRKERIAEGLNQAREAEQALARAEADKQAILDEARAEAQRITAEARQRADEASKTEVSQARAEAQRIREQAQTEAMSERDRQLSEMRDQIISLSMAAAHHLIGTSLDEKKQREIVENFFTQVPAEARTLGDSMMVITALPLTDGEKSKFVKALGAGEVTFRTDPSILGGVVLRSGAQEIDASFRNQLTGLRASLS
jgi:F-type H+-transporting ATPase subunit b